MKLINIDEYIEIFEHIDYHLHSIKSICSKYQEALEGNCFYEHLTFNNIMQLIPKQMNHFTLGKYHNKILEIGFNAGHSSLLYLMANKNSTLTVFDICEHQYTLECFDYLQKAFPNRLSLVIGDSIKTVPEFHKQNPQEIFDLIHIDGCHDKRIANKDFFNCFKIASDTIVFDDTHDMNLNDLFEKYIELDLIEEVLMYRTKFYEHRIGKIKKE